MKRRQAKQVVSAVKRNFIAPIDLLPAGPWRIVEMPENTVNVKAICTCPLHEPRYLMWDDKYYLQQIIYPVKTKKNTDKGPRREKKQKRQSKAQDTKDVVRETKRR